MDQTNKIINEYRTTEFIKLSRLIMLWVGVPVIVFWSIMDYQEWGFSPFWIIFRATFPIYAVACVYLSNLPIFIGPRVHQIPFVIYTAYILIFCTYFISQSGYENSRYLVGMPQIILSMSFLPFGIVEFLIVALVYSLIPILVATKLFNDLSLFDGPAFPLYITYSMFAVLTYFVVDHIRKTSFKNKAMLYLDKKNQQTLIDSQARELAESRVSVAIAATVQMLAHDVRKPFSMLKTGLNLLQASAVDPNKFKSNLTFLVSEVDRATKSVDGMLTDVMEIGSTSTELIQEPASPEALIESTLSEVFRVYPKSKIAITYDLKHISMVNVHLKKVSRVFSNIVGNAAQAMNYSGSMWFKTKNERDFVLFCIGNAGSMIPTESLTKLFEAFFTSGKKGGTGLGLAIAQKVVQAHGGKIWCESSKTPEHPDGKVEFFFTLPIAKNAELLTTANLPKHSDEITQVIAMMGQASKSKSDSEFNRSEGLLHQEVIQRARALSRSLGVLIIDDESIYRSALAGWIDESAVLTRLCNIHHASGSIEAFDILKSQTIDLIITDIDMGPKSLCGFDLVKELRSTQEFKGLIFVHSNRIVPEDHRRAGDLGANGFLPKPMAKGQLFKLLLQTIQWLSPLEHTAMPKGYVETAGTSPVADSRLDPVVQEAKSPYNLVAIIDDEDIFRDQWPAFLKDFDTVCYDTAEDFVKDWDQVSGRLLGVLTDKYLGSGIDGIKLGTMLRQKAPDLAIILSTSDMSVKNDSNIFDMIVDKDAFEEAPKITEYLRTKTKEEGLPSLMRKTMRAFDSHVRDLDENPDFNPDFTSIIDSHILSWEFILKDWDAATKAKLKGAMAKTEKDRLKHDIKGSITRFKILLRNLDEGEMDREGILISLKTRAADLAIL